MKQKHTCLRSSFGKDLSMYLTLASSSMRTMVSQAELGEPCVHKKDKWSLRGSIGRLGSALSKRSWTWWSLVAEGEGAVGWMKWTSRPIPHTQAPSKDFSKASGRLRILKPRTLTKKEAVFRGKGTAKLIWLTLINGRETAGSLHVCAAKTGGLGISECIIVL